MVNISSYTFNILLEECMSFRDSINLNIATLAVRAILSVSLAILVFFLGHQRWRRRRSFKATSHSDMFTYHLASMHLLWVPGIICYNYGLHAFTLEVISVGLFATIYILIGEMLFHVLTCVDRYLAVVHPVIYLGLKGDGGVRIRNISIGCVWLLCFVLTGLITLKMPDFPVVEMMSFLIFSLIVVSFCSLSALCVLIRPGPGGQKECIDQSKQRAVHMMTAILGVLWFWFVGFLVSICLYDSHLLSSHTNCLVIMSANWFNLPSSLVLPLLYLHRKGKLPCC